MFFLYMSTITFQIIVQVGIIVQGGYFLRILVRVQGGIYLVKVQGRMYINV